MTELHILQSWDLENPTPEEAASIQERIARLQAGIVALQEEIDADYLFSDLNASVWSINHMGEA